MKKSSISSIDFTNRKQNVNCMKQDRLNDGKGQQPKIDKIFSEIQQSIISNTIKQQTNLDLVLGINQKNISQNFAFTRKFAIEDAYVQNLDVNIVENNLLTEFKAKPLPNSFQQTEKIEPKQQKNKIYIKISIFRKLLICILVLRKQMNFNKTIALTIWMLLIDKNLCSGMFFHSLLVDETSQQQVHYELFFILFNVRLVYSFIIILHKLWIIKRTSKESVEDQSDHVSQANQSSENISAICLIQPNAYILENQLEEIETFVDLLTVLIKPHQFMLGMLIALISFDDGRGYPLISFYGYAELLVHSALLCYRLLSSILIYLRKYLSLQRVYKEQKNPRNNGNLPSSLETKQVFHFEWNRIQHICCKLLTWALFPICCQLIFFLRKESMQSPYSVPKSLSNCLTWMLIDSLLSIILLVYLLVFVIRLIVTKSHLKLRNNENSKVVLIDVFGNYVNSSFTVILFIFVFVKMMWVVGGVLYIYLKENFLQSCSEYLRLFLAAYFTQTLLLMYESCQLFIQGYKKGKQIAGQNFVFNMMQQNHQRTEVRPGNTSWNAILGAAQIMINLITNFGNYLWIICLGLQNSNQDD